ncbi:hypothetical protein WT14_22130 [Burkholderia stagnalis]|nr:hypothetical protein WT14_22130 [Burkholderia stagnalis]KWH44685.1 hypothetical protein WT62_01380 [Burkholderia stagnalis]KWI29485.1 hypothetical protein WT71_13985 [Burkholderia stagnalis]KWI70285.1 hypothetical protein WT73_15165 [Burkholderia stagnalis]
MLDTKEHPMRQASRSIISRVWPAAVAHLFSRHRDAASADAGDASPAPSPARFDASAAQEDRANHASWLDERSFCLYVPTDPDGAEWQLAAWADRLRTLGLASIVTTAREPRRDSLDVLSAGCESGVSEAEPYLEVVVGGETGAFLYYRGDEIERELAALHEVLDRHARAGRPAS